MSGLKHPPIIPPLCLTRTGDDPLAALMSLLQKEPPVPPELVTGETETGPVETILFAADPGFPLYRPEPAMEELADMLASAVGHIGTMAEYLLNTVSELERAGVHDLHLWHLQEMVAERLERLPDPVCLPLLALFRSITPQTEALPQASRPW